jgi:hypothetical protein
MNLEFWDFFVSTQSLRCFKMLDFFNYSIFQYSILFADTKHYDAYPDPCFHFDADPDSTFHFDADPNRLFSLMRFRIPLFTLLRIRIWFVLIKAPLPVVKHHPRLDSEPPRLYCTLSLHT